MNSPNIYSKACAIYSENKTAYSLCKMVNELFRMDDYYFATFHFPVVNEGRNDGLEFEEDNYLSQMIGGENTTFINNAIAKIRTEKIIIVGFDDKQKSFISHFPQKRVIFIDSEKDLLKLSDLKTEYVLNQDKKEHIVVVENGEDNHNLIAENFARSINAELLYVQDTDKYLMNKVTKYLQEWKGGGNKYASFVKLQNLVNNRIGTVDFIKYKTATFFTHGIPYGLVLGNPIPCCYVEKNLREDHFIINNILYSEYRFGTGMIFSIDEFLMQEPLKIKQTLLQNGIKPIELFLGKASTFNLQHYTSFLPYDILHISTHGGRASGYKVIENFKDRMDIIHTLEYWEIPTFSTTPYDHDDIMTVFRKVIFKKLDGLPWISDKLNQKNLPHYVFEDMRKKVLGGNMAKGIKREPLNSDITNSYVILCNNGQHQAHFIILAGHNSPVVFNNSCWSWGELATFFLVAGARSYIGTLWSINTQIAENSAIEFYKQALEYEKPICEVIWEINKNIKVIGQENIFLPWCLPFSCLKKCTPDEHMPNFVMNVLNNLEAWIEKTVNSPSKEVRDNSERIVRFMLWVLHKEFHQNPIEEMQDLILKRYRYDLSKNSDILRYRNFPLK